MISYSAGSSGSGDDVEKVRAATELTQIQWSELVIDGPMLQDLRKSVNDLSRGALVVDIVFKKSLLFNRSQCWMN
jgi:phosphotransacetylase